MRHLPYLQLKQVLLSSDSISGQLLKPQGVQCNWRLQGSWVYPDNSVTIASPDFSIGGLMLVENSVSSYVQPFSSFWVQLCTQSSTQSVIWLQEMRIFSNVPKEDIWCLYFTLYRALVHLRQSCSPFKACAMLSNSHSLYNYPSLQLLKCLS